MEPQGSFPHSQVPIIRPFPEPARSSPYPHIPLPEDPSILLSSHRRLGLSSEPLSLRFPRQNPVYASPLPHTCHMPRPSHFLNFITQTILGEEYRSLRSSLCSFLHSPVTSSLLGPNILLDTLFPNTLSLRFSLNVSDHVSHPYKTGKIIILYIFKFFDSKLEDKRFYNE